MTNDHAQYETTMVVSLEHPAIAGHFPNNPIVPAVVILETAWQSVHRYLKNLVLEEVVNAKFNAVLRPGVEFRVQFESAPNSQLNFRCIENEICFASGVFRVAPDVIEGHGA